MKIRILYFTIALVLVFTLLASCAQPAPEEPAAEEPAAEEPAAEEPPEEMPEEGALPPIVVAVWSSPEHENLVESCRAVYQGHWQ